MKSLLRAVMVILLLFSSLINANPNPGVSEWVKQTLSNTLSICFDQQNDNLASIRNNYTYDSWNALFGFLGDYIEVVRTQKLTIHPFFKEDPTVVAHGVSSGINFWRVNQTVVLPELNVEIFFSIIVLLRSSTSEDPYVIQSMDIIKRNY